MATINFFGISSGLDTGNLINALLDQKRFSRIKPLEDKVSTFQNTNTALQSLTDKLNALKSAASSFRAIEGGSISKSVSVSNESVLTGTATNAAANGSFNITVSQLASNATGSFNNSFSSGTSVINSEATPGDVDFVIGSGPDQESFSISVDENTTVNDFVQAFNSSSSKAVATTVNVGTSEDPQYKIVINTTSEGTTAGQLSITDGGFFSGQTISQATDAQLSVSGISGTITRSSNSISDLIPGVTLNLAQTGSTTLTVNTDGEASTASFEEFVEAYNDLVKFIKESDAVTFEIKNGKPNAVFGSLSSTSIDESVLSAVKSALSSSGVSGGSVAILADLGITTQQDGTLKFDKNTFQNALSNNPDAVKNIAANVGEKLSSVGGTIDQFTRFGGIIGNGIQNNKNAINNLQNRIINLEQSLEREEESLIKRFSNLEKVMGQLQAQQAAFSSIISGLKF